MPGAESFDPSQWHPAPGKTCRRACGGVVEQIHRQTRILDEGITTFYRCTRCMLYWMKL